MTERVEVIHRQSSEIAVRAIMSSPVDRATAERLLAQTVEDEMGEKASNPFGLGRARIIGVIPHHDPANPAAAPDIYPKRKITVWTVLWDMDNSGYGVTVHTTYEAAVAAVLDWMREELDEEGDPAEYVEAVRTGDFERAFAIFAARDVNPDDNVQIDEGEIEV